MPSSTAISSLPSWVSDCGRVTLYHGDCLEHRHLVPADAAIISDPPYGMKYETRASKWPGQKAKQKDGQKWGKKWHPIEGDSEQFDPTPWTSFPTWILWGVQWFCEYVPNGKTWLVWDKGSPKSWSGADCEIAATNFGNGGVRQWSCLWQGFNRDREIREHYHPTQKPVDLMAWCMDQAKVPAGAVVVDPYMGSGSTIIAAIRTGRKAIGFDKDLIHYATALERIKIELSQMTLNL